MSLYTFEAFAMKLAAQNHIDPDYVRRNLIFNEKLQFVPNFVVDLPSNQGRRGDEKFQELNWYGIQFANLTHMAPDLTTAYFIDADDALLFRLASA